MKMMKAACVAAAVMVLLVGLGLGLAACGPSAGDDPASSTAPSTASSTSTLPPTTPGAGEGAPQVDLAATETAVAQQAEANTPRTPLAINDRAAVCCTDMAGLRLRAEAGTEHPVVKLLEEGKIVEIIGGPKEASGFTWWQVQDEVGTSGWAAEDFMLKQE